jgi:acetyl esterase/lipase
MTILQAVCEYKRVRGCSIRAGVYLPGRERPAVLVYIHGGALISGSRAYLSAAQREMYLRAGFAVVSIDYRLAPVTPLPEIVADVRDALQWVRGEGASAFGWDAERLAVAGGSAGGYLSLLTGTFAVAPRAIVSFYGYGDILAPWYTQPSAHYLRTMPLIGREQALAAISPAVVARGGPSRYTYYFYTRQQGIWPEAVSGISPVSERERLLPYCPAYNIGPGYPPTLLLHGDADTDVPCEQSQQMAAELSRLGRPNKLLVLPGAGHGFDADARSPQVRQALQEVLTFLQEQLG